MSAPTTTSRGRRRVERPGAEPDVHRLAEVRQAARTMLLRPLLVGGPGDAGDDLRLVRRHRDELTRLFADGLGYRLVVEPQAARLFKPGLGRDATRPWRRRSEAPFTPRMYALFCLALAALTRSRSQLLVDELVAQVRSAAVDAGVDVDLDSTADRRAMHAVLVRLVALGVLHERDGDLEHWVEQRTQSLLDVRRDVLPLLVSANLTGAGRPGDLLEVRALPSAAGGARVAIRRRLVEQPVLTTEDLTDDQAEWWRRNRRRESDWFADSFGVELELRAEGAVAIDPAESLSDVDFPGRGSVNHLALLLVAELTAVARPAEVVDSAAWRTISAADVRACSDRVLHRWKGGLRKDLREDPASAARQAVDVLAAVGLVRRSSDDGALSVHAAAARYAPTATLAESSTTGERSCRRRARTAAASPASWTCRRRWCPCSACWSTSTSTSSSPASGSGATTRAFRRWRSTRPCATPPRGESLSSTTAGTAAVFRRSGCDPGRSLGRGGRAAGLGGPPLHDLWRRAAERLERNGLRPTGRFRVPTPTRRLQRAVGDLVGREVTTSQCTVDLADLDRRLRLRAGTEGVVDAAERALGRRLTDRPAAGEEQRLQRNAVLGRARERLDASGLGSQHWVDDWLAGLQRDGLLTRHADSEGVLPGAVEALGAALTVDEVLARTELAARVLHDSHALDDGSPVARLVLRALAQRAGVTSPSSD